MKVVRTEGQERKASEEVLDLLDGTIGLTRAREGNVGTTGSSEGPNPVQRSGSLQKMVEGRRHERAPIHVYKKTSQELQMLSSVTINCQITKIVMNSGSQLSEL